MWTSDYGEKDGLSLLAWGPVHSWNWGHYLLTHLLARVILGEQSQCSTTCLQAMAMLLLCN